MELKTATLLVEVNPDLELREEYSGRGMFGDKTSGVTGDINDFILAVASVAYDLGMEGDGFDEFQDDLNNLKTDSMGRDSTIFY